MESRSLRLARRVAGVLALTVLIVAGGATAASAGTGDGFFDMVEDVLNGADAPRNFFFFSP
ncbi:hypothetical protein [Bailinhaonella thermotolerans]|uniref:Uncharacterized protein n=1 Tax=Bailinhaonella thermotolerans TaxID=1070861 RepID=A0A3A4B3Z2_9ACTN|nr:hypothetical protein [Bailinhaonella thermotolerans]RJL32739.1 hypothetical protein D5H75_14765 [Bailinhaonella thermotolerans]